MKTKILKRQVNNIGHNKKLLLNQTWNENIDLKKQQYLQHRTDERILFLKYIDDLICAKKYGYNTTEPKRH